MTGAEPRHEALMRVALLGAGTSVWEWNIETDALDDHHGGDLLLGYAPGETGATQAGWNRLIHPDDLATNHAAYERHARGETQAYESEYRARAKDAGWRWISERGRIVEWTPAGRPLRMVGTISDITQRRLAEGDAQDLAERLRRVARHVPGIVFQFRLTPDGRGHFPYVSESCRDVVGLAPRVLMRDATAMLRLVEREDRALMRESIQRSARTLQAWACEFRLFRHGGATRWMTGTATPQRDANGAVLWHGYIAETTQMRELERAQRVAATAQAANAAKTEFLSRMSHELRTPLNAVLGFAQLLELDPREPLSPTQRQRVTLIREAGAHLLEMIGELLDLTRIESGQLAMVLGAVALVPLLQECMAMLRPQASVAAVRVVLEPDDAALCVRADRTRLRQVVLNLLSNAIKYNRSGGAVRLHLDATATHTTLRVADTGVGIAPEDLHSVFEPFNRGAHRRSVIEGTGIGLAVTRGLVEQMHGRLEAESVVGAGSTFSVTLPRCPDQSVSQSASLPT